MNARMLGCTVLLGSTLLFAQDPAKTDKRLTVASARALLHGHYAARNPGDDFKVVDRTTDDIWKRLGIQVFRVTAPDHLSAETHVIQDGKIHPIGRNFGGEGVTSLVAADAGKKKYVLVCAFAWGSGVHRSQLGVFDPAGSKQITLPISNRSFDDFEVKGEDGVAVVFMGKRRVGTVALDETDGVLAPAFRPADDCRRRFATSSSDCS